MGEMKIQKGKNMFFRTTGRITWAIKSGISYSFPDIFLENGQKTSFGLWIPLKNIAFLSF